MCCCCQRGQEAAIAVPPAFLNLAYPIPRDTVSFDDYERRRHRDLPHLSGEDLALEGYRVMLRLCFEREMMALAWLRERRLAVRGEMAHRLRVTRAEPRPAPPDPDGDAASATPGNLLTLVHLAESAICQSGM